MEIALLRSLPVGSAAEISVNVDGGVNRLRLLRKTADTISGWDDPAATVVCDESVAVYSQIRLIPSLLDLSAIQGTTYYYAAFGYHVASAAWRASVSAAITIAASAELVSPDPLIEIADRLRKGLAERVAASAIKPASGGIEVLFAPPLIDRTHWPVVTVHLDSDQSSERAIGEFSAPDLYDPDLDAWDEGEGWLSRYVITVIGWTPNPEERLSLRRAIKHILMGNLPAFEQLGIVTPELTQRDIEDMDRYEIPMYQTLATLTCLAPAWFAGRTAAVDDIEVTETVTETLLEVP